MDFAETVFKFYPSETLKADLLTPELSKNSDSVFQHALSVLQSLVGYSVVILGKKRRGKKSLEIIQLDSGFQAGSADLIAFKEHNKLFLIDCTTGAVDDPKIRKLQQTIKFISKKEKRDKSEVIGIIFSSQDCKELRCHYHEDTNIVDSSRLKLIFDLLLEGKMDEIRKKLITPY